MARPGVSELLLHNFPENGVKFLLHHPNNLQDLLRLLAGRHPALPDPAGFDCARRTIEPDTIIRGDFSHGVTDLLLRLPFRTSNQGHAWIRLYLLVEHLSAHQRHIVPRSLGYALDVYRLQERRWRETHASLQGLRYEVVVPIVIYTGERPWQAPTPFRDLVQGGDVFAPFVPSVEPLFLSLPEQAEPELLERGGALGPVLHVLRQRHAPLEVFQPLLTRMVGAVEGQVGKDWPRLLELLAYLTALVYHFRNQPERAGLRADLERSIQTHAIRKEVQTMGQTIAEALREEGEREGERKGTLRAKQQTLIMQLRRKFGRKVTAAVVAAVERTKDVATLDGWLSNVVDARQLEAVGIPGKKEAAK
jgi:hypothetical protein